MEKSTAALLRQVLDDNHAHGHTTPGTLNEIEAAILATLPEPLAPAAPAAQGFDAELVAAGERLVNLIEGPGCMRWEDGQGFRLKDTTEWSVFYIAIKRALATAAKGVPAQDFDAEFWKKAWVEERARAYRREGMRVEQAKIHAETDAASALAAAAKGVGK